MICPRCRIERSDDFFKSKIGKQLKTCSHCRNLRRKTSSEKVIPSPVYINVSLRYEGDEIDNIQQLESLLGDHYIIQKIDIDK